MDYHDYLKSPAWKAKRDRVMRREVGVCERCGDEADHVHHKTYDRIFRERLSDLQALCSACHRFVHGRSTVDPAEYTNWIERYLAILDEKP